MREETRCILLTRTTLGLDGYLTIQNKRNTDNKSAKNIGSNNACKYNGNTIVDENEHHATNNDD